MTLFDLFRKKLKPLPLPVPENPSGGHGSLREEVNNLYDRGLNPILAITKILHDLDGNLRTNAKEIADIYLGINDILDRDGIEITLRNQLVNIREVAAKVIEDAGPGPKTFVENYRSSTRRINEMRFLQSYNLKDSDGNIQRESFERMLLEIEHERAHHPGSLTQDISDEALAKLYDLRDNWDNPSKFCTNTPPIVAKHANKSDVEEWVKYIENSCVEHLGDVANFIHPDWDPAAESGDFRTLVTMYAAACTAHEKRADKMFAEWMTGATRVGIDTNKTTEFYFMANRRFSHLAQIRCYFDYQLKLTLVPPDQRAKALPMLAQLLSPEMSDAFFLTPASMSSRT